jgi:hypothetical protein
VSRVTELWADRSDFDGPADLFSSRRGLRPERGRGFAEEAGTGGPPAGLDRPYARQTQGREKRELRGEIILHPSDA